MISDLPVAIMACDTECRITHFNRAAVELHCAEPSRELKAEITVDKHKVLQILVNLVRNATQACDQSGHREKLITLRIGASPRGVRISVLDNGSRDRAGEHAASVPARLHDSPLRPRFRPPQRRTHRPELGGTLHAESAGIGMGAAFILELPLAPTPAEIA